MVSPSRRRDAIKYLLGRHPVSERRACQLVGQHRSTQRYAAVPATLELRLVARMNELAAQHPRYGYRRIWALLRAEGFAVNKKRVERLWRLEGHRVPPASCWRIVFCCCGSSTPDYVYDKLGRTVSPASPAGQPSVPAADAGGQGLTLTYYENDLVRSMAQAGNTTTIDLDPGLRPKTRTTTVPAQSTTSFYGGDDDEPIATKTGSTITREIEGLDGDLAATKVGAGAVKLQVSNLHGDVVSEADVTASTLSTAWGTDEFGVPHTTPSGGGGGSGPATITKVGATKAARTTNGTTLAINKPTGVQEGDLMLAGLAVNSGSSITPPAGWAAVAGAETVSGSSKWQLFSKYATASEGSSYTFTASGSSKHAGGITALRDTATSNPVNAVSTSTGFGKDITAPSVTPTQDGSAIEILVGNNTGDNNGGEAWGVTSPLSLDWSTATGASSSGNRTAGMALRVYVPHIGRFLQVDPVYGGSANAYDYGLQDPVNQLDLDGRCVLWQCISQGKKRARLKHKPLSGWLRGVVKNVKQHVLKPCGFYYIRRLTVGQLFHVLKFGSCPGQVVTHNALWRPGRWLAGAAWGVARMVQNHFCNDYYKADKQLMCRGCQKKGRP